MGPTLIAVPCIDAVPVEFLQSFVNLHKIGDTRYALIQNTLVYDARNTFAAKAIQGEYDRVLWIDSDMTFEADALERLSATMDETGADLVCGLCFKRKLPTMPVIYSAVTWEQKDGLVKAHAEPILDYPKDAVFPVAGCGFGLVLTKAELLRRVWDKCGAPFDPMPNMGEDIAFCYKAEKVGAKMLCDSRVKAGHVGRMVFDENVFLKG